MRETVDLCKQAGLKVIAYVPLNHPFMDATSKDPRYQDWCKRFADGTTEPLEGIFINQRRIEGKTSLEITSDHTTFGLGVTSVDFTFAGSTFDRLYYERK